MKKNQNYRSEYSLFDPVHQETIESFDEDELAAFARANPDTTSMLAFELWRKENYEGVREFSNAMVAKLGIDIRPKIYGADMMRVVAALNLAGESRVIVADFVLEILPLVERGVRGMNETQLMEWETIKSISAGSVKIFDGAKTLEIYAVKERVGGRRELESRWS